MHGAGKVVTDAAANFDTRFNSMSTEGSTRRSPSLALKVLSVPRNFFSWITGFVVTLQ